MSTFPWLISLCASALAMVDFSMASSASWLINANDCGVTKGCYRVPNGCKGEHDCIYFLTWRKGQENEIKFEFAALFGNHTKPPWSGFGVANEPKMLDSTVVDCIVNSSGFVNIQMSYNVKEHHNNEVLDNKYLGLVPSSFLGAVANSHIFCSFTRLKVVKGDVESDKVKNFTMPYYILFATGQTDGNGVKMKHDFNDVDPYASSILVDFNNYTDFGDSVSKSAFIRVHATLMIAAWIIFASLGMFTSRYMKNQWKENGTFCGMPGWFQVHRYSLALVLVLTLAGVLTIFAYNEWRFIFPDVGTSITSIHPTLGLVVCSLLAVNFLAGMFRPNIYSPYRRHFRYFHAFAGHTGHLVAAVTIYFGVMQYKALMPYWCRWVVVGFACWRILSDIVMSLTRILYRDQPVNYVAMANNEVDELETQGSAWRCAVMIVYLIGIAILAVTLIVAANV